MVKVQRTIVPFRVSFQIFILNSLIYFAAPKRGNEWLGSIVKDRASKREAKLRRLKEKK
jgi:hypothetical protein